MTVEAEEKHNEEVSADLFKDVTYYIVGEISQQVMGLLNRGGANRDTYLSEMVSHVIADDATQMEYSEAKELFDLPVVSSQWVKMSVKCRKQLPISLFQIEGMLFTGVVACSSQLEDEDRDAIWGMITCNGGQCQQALNKLCTHLITSSLEGAKYDKATEKGDSIKIVTPDWVTDSIVKGSRLDEILYHPRLIEYPKPEPPTPPPPPEEPMETAPPFVGLVPRPSSREMARSPGKQVIAQQLAAAVLERRSSNEDGGMGGQGSRPTTPSAAKEALARMVSNRIQASGRPSNSQSPKSPVAQQYPTQMSFPYPMPQQGLQQGLPPFSQQEMLQAQMRTLRNITNSAEHMPQMPGVRPNANKISQMMGLNMPQQQHPPQQRQPPPAYPPPSFPYPQSHHPQYPMMPSYWGHDPSDNVPPDMCLFGCVFYITDYQKLVGQEQINNWRKVISQHGGQVDNAYSNRVTHLLCANQDSDIFKLAVKDQRWVVSAYWLNDVLFKKKMLPPWQALHLPIKHSEIKPCKNQIICVTNFDGDERTRIKQMITAIGAKYTGYMTHSNSALICKKPEGLKYDKAKEWHIPVVNVQWLSDLVIGYYDALSLPVNSRYLQVGHGDPFMLDLNKVANVMVGWRSSLKIAKEQWKKFVPLQKPRPAPGQENNVLPPPDIREPLAKRQRLEMEDLTSKSGPRVLFTGFPRGVAKKLQAMVLQLGGMVTENPKQCTHIVAPCLSRTMKFFVAINVCKFILTKHWLEDSLSQNRLVDESPYWLKDVHAEREMQCNIRECVFRSQNKPLFEGMMFYISPGVSPPALDITNVVESAGGKVVKRRPALKTIAAHKDDKGNPTFIVVTCENDIHLFRDLIAKKIAVYNAEFVLTGVMRQTIDYVTFQIDVH